MASLLDQASLFEHEDPVRAAHGRQPVGDDDRRVPAPAAFEGGHDFALGTRIDRGQCIVEDENRRFHEQGPRQGEALALAAGQGHAAFADAGPIPRREADDGVVNGGFPGRGHHLVVVRVGAGDAQVVRHGARIQEGILHDDAKLATQPVTVHVADIEAVDQDASRLRFVEPGQEANQGGLAGTRRTDDADGLAGGDVHREIPEHRSTRLVFDGQVLENELPPGPRDGRHRIAALLLGQKDVVYACQGDHRLAGFVQHLAQVPHRPDHHGHLHHEGEQFAHRERAGGEEHAARDQHDAHLGGAQEVADGPVDAAQAVKPFAVVP